jgi:hypothetical protein
MRRGQRMPNIAKTSASPPPPHGRVYTFLKTSIGSSNLPMASCYYTLLTLLQQRYVFQVDGLKLTYAMPARLVVIHQRNRDCSTGFSQAVAIQCRRSSSN